MRVNIADIPFTIPPTSVPCPGKDDRGKKVSITSCGGALREQHGIILSGPYTFTYVLPSKTDANGKKHKDGKSVPRKFTSVPYWCVFVEGYNLVLHFIEGELKFV